MDADQAWPRRALCYGWLGVRLCQLPLEFIAGTGRPNNRPGDRSQNGPKLSICRDYSSGKWPYRVRVF